MGWLCATIFGLLSYNGEDSIGGAGGSIDVGEPEFTRSCSSLRADCSSAEAISLVTALGLSIGSSKLERRIAKRLIGHCISARTHTLAELERLIERQGAVADAR